MLKLILKRLTNTTTLIAVASAIALLIKTFGVDIDLEKYDTIINLICTIGISIGVLGNPDTEGLS
jgi:uncharacterized membrane protein